ncbi:MAG: hypothetical protein AAGD33_14975 [Actinomycetota bacterium]
MTDEVSVEEIIGWERLPLGSDGYFIAPDAPARIRAEVDDLLTWLNGQNFDWLIEPDEGRVHLEIWDARLSEPTKRYVEPTAREALVAAVREVGQS